MLVVVVKIDRQQTAVVKFVMFFTAFFLIQLIYPCSGYYHLRWEKHRKIFVPFVNITSFFDKQTLSFRESEISNFHGRKIKFAYYHEESLIDFRNNDTRVSGVIGEVWTMLADYLNFTLVPVRYHRENYGFLDEKTQKYSGLLSLIQENKVDIIPRVNFYLGTWNIMDYTVPLWKNSFQTYILPEFKGNDSWIFKMFSLKVWLLVMTFTIAFSILGTLSERIIVSESGRHGISDHIFFTLATLCAQGWLPKHLDGQSKTLEISRRFFSWLILITLSSHLISYMTTTKMEPPFDNIETLFNKTKYRLVVYNGSMAFDRFQRFASHFRPEHRKRIIFEPIKERMNYFACRDKVKLAVIESDDRQRASGRKSCTLVKAGYPLFRTWITSGIIKGFKNKRSLDLGMIRLHESGLIDGLKDRWMSPEPVVWNQSNVDSIGLKHIYMLFVIVILGAILSVIIFILEKIVFLHQHESKKKRKKKRKRRYVRKFNQILIIPNSQILNSNFLRKKY